MKNNDNSIFISFGSFDPPIGVQITETQFEQLQTNNTANSQTNIAAEGVPPEGEYIQVGAFYVPIITTLSQSNIVTTTSNNANTSAPPAVEPVLTQPPLLSLVHPNATEEMVTINYPRGNIAVILTNNGQNTYPWNIYLEHDQNLYSSNPSYQTLADAGGNFNQLLTTHNHSYFTINGNPLTLTAWQDNNNIYQQMLHSSYFNQVLSTYSDYYQAQNFANLMTTAEVPRYSTVFTFNPFHAFPNYETFAASYGMNSNTISLYQTLHTHWTNLQASVNPHGTRFIDPDVIIADGAVIHHEVDFSGAHLNPFLND